MPSSDFPARVRAERERLGLTQEAAAVLASMTRGGYKQIEDSPRDVRVSTLARLVQAGYRLETLAPELVQ